MNGRVYDPAIGRFMSADPLVQAPENSQSHNRYSYVLNNPLSLTDPSGFALETGWDVSWAAVGIASMTQNYMDGNYFSAGLDAIGVGVDLAASALPGVPTPGTPAIQAGRWGFRALGELTGLWGDEAAEAAAKAAGAKADEAAEAAAKAADEAARAADKAKEAVSFERPSGYRTGVRDTVWDNAIEPSTGRVRDPMTGQFMSKNKPWDMGHKPGYEFRKLQNYAKKQQLPRNEFLDKYNDPKHFRPELPSSNRCHKCEDDSKTFLGGDESDL